MTTVNKTSRVFAGKQGRFRVIHDGAQFTVAHVLVCISVGGLEVGLAYRYFAGVTEATTYALAHAEIMAGVVAAITLAAWKRQDLGLLSLLLATSLFTGPFGSVGCAAMSLYLLLLRASPKRLNVWYDKISGSIPRDPVSDLYEAIDSGRQSVEKFPSNRAFLDVLQNGSWRQQQIVIGLISRNFNDDFLPILTRALKSPNALIRTQAAATANRLPRKHRDKIWAPVSRI